MKKRKRLSPGRFLCLVNLAWFAIVAALLLANGWQYNARIRQDRTIGTIAAELRWQSHVTARAEAQVEQLPELRFIDQAMETNNRDMYAIARAAWKWGKAIQVSPYLITAVAHRESNFDPRARSYDKEGNPLAYGCMQINFQVWKDELKLDMARMDEVDYNVEKATRILKHYLDQNQGDVSAALFAYWGGALAGGSYSYPPRVLESKYFDTQIIGQNAVERVFK